MGPVGWQEMMFIFLLALLLFGPKKLPELGRMVGRAITEFRRAQSELKSTFEREMRNLERENEALKGITSGYQPEAYNYDYSGYDGGAYSSTYNSGAEAQDSTVTSTSTTSASASEGARSEPTASPEGVIAHGVETANSSGHTSEPEGVPAATDSAATGMAAVEHTA